MKKTRMQKPSPEQGNKKGSALAKLSPLAAAIVFSSTPLMADTFVVNSTNNESEDTDGLMSLQEAFIAAEESTGGDIITFDSTLFEGVEDKTIVVEDSLDVTTSCSKCDKKGSASSSDDNSVIIDGADIAGLTLQITEPPVTKGGPPEATFEVDSATLTLKNMVIDLEDDDESSETIISGNHDASIILDNVTLIGNADGYGRGIFLKDSQLTMTNSTITGMKQNRGSAIYAYGYTSQVYNYETKTYEGEGVQLSIANSQITDNVSISEAVVLVDIREGDGAMVDITDTTFSGNGPIGILTGNNANGALFLQTSDTCKGAKGAGGEFAEIEATITNSTFSGNRGDRGAAINASPGCDSEIDVTLNGTSVTGNESQQGAIVIDSEGYVDLQVISSNIDSNTAYTEGSALSVLDNGEYATVQIEGSTISGNQNDNGPAVMVWRPSRFEISNSTVDGNTNAMEEDWSLYHPLAAAGLSFANNNSESTMDVYIEDSTLSNNVGTGTGGAIAVFGISEDSYINLDMTNTLVSGNQSFIGAGITAVTTDSSDSNINIDIAYSTFDSNTTTSVYQEGEGMLTSLGGAIATSADISETSISLSISDSTLSNNSADAGGAIAALADNGYNEVNLSGVTMNGNSAVDVDGKGGAILAYADSSDVILNIINSTITQNTGAKGSAINLGNNAYLNMTNATVAANMSDGAGSAMYANSDGESQAFDISNSIISDNTLAYNDLTLPADATLFISGIEGSSSFANSIIGSAVIVGGDPTSDEFQDAKETILNSSNLIGVDPGLGTLADNGGPTQTICLAPNSPAIDAGDTGIALENEVLVDQRGEDRFGVGDAVDIGALEITADIACEDTTEIGLEEPEVEETPVEPEPPEKGGGAFGGLGSINFAYLAALFSFGLFRRKLK